MLFREPTSSVAIHSFIHPLLHYLTMRRGEKGSLLLFAFIRLIC